jgi:hypothetical protein
MTKPKGIKRGGKPATRFRNDRGNPPKRSSLSQTAAYSGGVTPDEVILSDHVPVVFTARGGHIRCRCTWGDSGKEGLLILRFRSKSCLVKVRNGHK